MQVDITYDYLLIIPNGVSDNICLKHIFEDLEPGDKIPAMVTEDGDILLAHKSELPNILDKHGKWILEKEEDC